jgi:hypothetical protein
MPWQDTLISHDSIIVTLFKCGQHSDSPFNVEVYRNDTLVFSFLPYFNKKKDVILPSIPGKYHVTTHHSSHGTSHWEFSLGCAGPKLWVDAVHIPKHEIFEISKFKGDSIRVGWEYCGHSHMAPWDVKLIFNNSIIYECTGQFNTRTVFVLPDREGTYQVGGMSADFYFHWRFQVVHLWAEDTEPIPEYPAPETVPNPGWNLTIAPNPICDKLKIITTNDELLEVKLIDSKGKVKLYKAPLRDESFEISVSELPRGLYFIYVTTWRGLSRWQKVQLIDPW